MINNKLSVKAHYDGFDTTAICPVCGVEAVVTGPLDGNEKSEESCEHFVEMDGETATFLLEDTMLEKIVMTSNELLDRLFFLQQSIPDKSASEDLSSAIVDLVKLQNSLSEWRQKYDKK